MNYTILDDRIEVNLEKGKLTVSSDEAIGYRPVELLVTSVASCSGAVYRTILNKQRINYDSLTIEANVERNEEEANRVEKMDLNFIVKGTDLNEKRLEKNFALVRKNCGMLRSVENSIEVTERLTIINK